MLLKTLLEKTYLKQVCKKLLVMVYLAKKYISITPYKLLLLAHEASLQAQCQALGS